MPFGGIAWFAVDPLKRPTTGQELASAKLIYWSAKGQYPASTL